MAFIPEIYLKAVVSIGVRNGEAINWIGTGFFLAEKVNDKEIQPYMVTNKHVLDNKDSVVIRFKRKDVDSLLMVAPFVFIIFEFFIK